MLKWFINPHATFSILKVRLSGSLSGSGSLPLSLLFSTQPLSLSSSSRPPMVLLSQPPDWLLLQARGAIVIPHPRSSKQVRSFDYALTIPTSKPINLPATPSGGSAISFPFLDITLVTFVSEKHRVVAGWHGGIECNSFSYFNNFLFFFNRENFKWFLHTHLFRYKNLAK